MRKTILSTDCYYHIYNRGVEKRSIFQEAKDYERFLLGLEEFNTPDPIHIATLSNNEARPRKKLIDVICFCLMPNHYHLIIKQAVDGGITQFMHKLGTGYAMYFNKKWGRKGILFEGKFKAKIIQSDEYLIHLSRYIHLNPLNIIDPHWKEKKLKDIVKASKFLGGYRWSSCPIYTKKSTSSIISLANIEKILQNTGDYEKFTLNCTPEDITTIESYEARPR